MDHHYESSGDEEVLEEKVVAVGQRVRSFRYDYGW